MTTMMPLPTLYQLTDEFLVAQVQLLELDVPDQVVQDTLESLQFPVEQKAIGVAQMVRNFEAQAAAINGEIERMQARAKAMANRAEKLKAYLKEQLERAGIKKIPCPFFEIAIRQNPASVQIDAGAEIPDAYMRMPPVPVPEPDKAAIKKAIEGGTEIAGCRILKPTRLEIK